MDIEQAIVGRLTADAGVSAQVQGRIYPEQAPQGVPFPMLVYQKVAGVPVMTYGGVAALNAYTMQLDVYAASYAAVKAAALAVTASLYGFGGPLGNGLLRVLGVIPEDQSDDLEPPIHAGEIGIYRIMITVRLWYGSTGP